MWKKLNFFKKNGTSSFNHHQKIYVLFIIIISNFLFYISIISKEDAPHFDPPLHFIKVQIEAKSLTPWEIGKKISLFDSNSKEIIEVAYFLEKSNDDFFELAIHEDEIYKVINHQEIMTIVPFQKIKNSEQKAKLQEMNFNEIIF